MMATIFSYRTAGRITFGPGASEQAGEAARALGAGRALLVSDPGVIAAGITERVQASLENAGCEAVLFSDLQPEPLLRNGEDAGRLCREMGCQVVVGVGGGSSMDTAKAAALLGKLGGSLRDYIGADRVPARGLPTVMVPTTAGTASEVTAAAVFTIPEEKLKTAVLSPNIIPDVALVDPLLTLGLPKQATAFSGMDALTHAVEGYVARAASPITDAVTLESIRYVGLHLRRAVHAPNDPEARSGMCLASLLAGMGFANSGVGLVHAATYPLGGVYPIRHGEGNGLMLPWVMQFALPASLEKFARIAHALGEDIHGLSLREAAQASVQAVRSLMEDIDFPLRLRDLGVPKEALPEMARGTMRTPRLIGNTPRTPTEEDVLRVFERAW